MCYTLKFWYPPHSLFRLNHIFSGSSSQILISRKASFIPQSEWVLITHSEQQPIHTSICCGAITTACYKSLFAAACLAEKSCPTLWDPMDYSLPGSSAHGISQARLLEWVATSFSRGSSQPSDWTRISCLAGSSLPLSHLGSESLFIQEPIYI